VAALGSELLTEHAPRAWGVSCSLSTATAQHGKAQRDTLQGPGRAPQRRHARTHARTHAGVMPAKKTTDFKIDEVVWVKLGSHPWWPARVASDEEGTL
jgi:hypothetical protein